ncbi:1-acyl-sn-glycerol-3-phosphate acyltransferase [Niastella caeni]|uniref:1-acyl-sn-glycerol-3-phosphate acyltransferase n=1 Tax=Niastella caeni TaxID=2569763 RepID=A0A4S8HIC1_9BACT|nr:lysophospholipid acyltransferase family protein [Niastella caeni]THU34867.1 1-acyl-sn-glycerol-3-phosphate acyltransferase [Niastella caeni]
MKFIKEIIGRICALWAALLFVATLLIILIPFLLFSYPVSDPKKTKRFAAIARVWMGIYLPLIGCPLIVRGRKNFAPGETYIVVCNHNSFMDVPISYPAIPGGNKTIAKIEMAKIPLFGMIYKTGSVLVDRKSDVSRKESYLQMRRVLDMGLNMCLYAEGTRNLTDQPLKSFHDGAFRLAMDSGKAIVPSLIFNTKKVLPASKPFFLMPHKMEMHFLPPVHVQPGDTTQALKERVFEIMYDYYTKNTPPNPLKGA